MASPFFKIAVLLGGSCFVAVCTSFSLGLFGIQDVSWKPLSLVLEKEDSSSYQESKVGKKFQHHLVAPYLEENRTWWMASLIRYKKDKANNVGISSDFQNVNLSLAFDKAESTNERKSINRICDDIYKNKDSGDVFKNTSGNKGYDDLSENFWRYCSDFEGTPLLVKDNVVGYDNLAIGEKKKGNYLISTDTEANDKLWRYKNNKFFRSKISNFADEVYFLNLRDKANDISNELILKEYCANAYRLAPTEAQQTETKEKPKEHSVVKHCSLEGI